MSQDEPLLVDTGKGFTIEWGGRYLASSYNPIQQAQRAAQALTLAEQTLYILYRPLFGYGLETLLEKLPPSSRILCIETDQSLFALTSAEYQKIVPNSSKSLYVRTQWGPSLDGQILKWGLWNFRYCKVISLGSPPVDEKLDGIFLYLQEKIVRYWKNRMTQIRLGRRWILNIFRNIKAMEQGEDLPETNKPVLVAGAGPSLDNLLMEEWNREDFFLLAVDTALPALTARGFKPDGVINLDGQYYNSLDYYQQPREILLFSDLTAWPSTLRNRRNLYFISEFTEMPFLSDIKESLNVPGIPPMGSVGVLALSIALALTKKEVILAGLDFAFPPGQSHCRGSISQQWLLYNQNRTKGMTLAFQQAYRGPLRALEEPGWYTNAQLEAYRKDLQDLSQMLSEGIMQYRGKGLDLGLPHWTPEYKFSEMEFDRPQTIAWSSARNNSSWIEARRRELEELQECWNSYVQAEETVETLLEKLRTMEYLYCDLPYNPPVPTDNPRVLLPIIQDARKLLKILES